MSWIDPTWFAMGLFSLVGLGLYLGGVAQERHWRKDIERDRDQGRAAPPAE